MARLPGYPPFPPHAPASPPHLWKVPSTIAEQEVPTLGQRSITSVLLFAAGAAMLAAGMGAEGRCLR